MALALTKRTRFARVYTEVIDGVTEGFMKASVGPMHYESVYGSGDYDTSIDLTWDAVDTSLLDGYEMTLASYQWELQTDVLAQSQQPQGTVTYRDRNGTNEFIMRAVQHAYLHVPTMAEELVGTAFNYVTGAVTADLSKIQRTRNLGSHAGVANETVVVNGAMRWDTLDTVDSQTVWAEFITKRERVEIGVLQHEDSAVWQYANEAPSTTEADTQFGVLYEVDFSGIPTVELADGTVVDPPTDDFNDSLGEILLKDADGNLIGRIVDTQTQQGYGNHFEGTSGFRTATRYFWENGGTNYMHIGIGVPAWEDSGSGPYRTLFKTVIASALEEGGPLHANDGWSGDYWFGGLENVGTYYTYNGQGHYGGATDFYAWQHLNRFHHELPFKASITGSGEYANFIGYDFYYPETYRGNLDRGTYDGPVYIDTFIDVGGSNQGYIVGGDVNNYGSWADSYNYTRSTGDFPVTDGAAHAPIDISLPMEEFLGLNGTASGKAVRLRTTGNGMGGANNYAAMDAYNGAFSKDSVLDVYFTDSGHKLIHNEVSLGHNDITIQHNSQFKQATSPKKHKR